MALAAGWKMPPDSPLHPLGIRHARLCPHCPLESQNLRDALLGEADFGPCRPNFLMDRLQVKRLEFFDEERLLKQSCA